MGVNDWGTPAEPLDDPELSAWADSVAAVVNRSDVTVNQRISDHESKADPHSVYLLPDDVLAGANITVDRLSTPGSVIIASSAGGGITELPASVFLHTGSNTRPAEAVPGSRVAYFMPTEPTTALTGDVWFNTTGVPL